MVPCENGRNKVALPSESLTLVQSRVRAWNIIVHQGSGASQADIIVIITARDSVSSSVPRMARALTNAYRRKPSVTHLLFCCVVILTLEPSHVPARSSPKGLLSVPSGMLQCVLESCTVTCRGHFPRTTNDPQICGRPNACLRIRDCSVSNALIDRSVCCG